MAEGYEPLAIPTKQESRVHDELPASTNPFIHDIVCIGFGSSSIAFAIALQESSPDTNILFLERQQRSNFSPFTRLPGSSMRLSFLNDLVTLENPRSKFSYTHYLHSTGQLVQFTNLGSVRPLREQFARYLCWCARYFDDRVQYSSNVEAITPLRRNGDGVVEAWNISYTDTANGQLKSTLAKHVICAVGLQPRILALLNDPGMSGSVFHSPNDLSSLFSNPTEFSRPHHFVVVGDGQDAAEVVEKLCGMRNSHRVTWIKTQSPEGSSSTPNLMKSSQSVSPYPGSAHSCEILQQNRKTELGSNIDPTLANHLSEIIYTQRVREADPRKWAFQIHSNIDLESARRSSDGKVCLRYRDNDSANASAEMVCDLVISATGYEASEVTRVLEPARELFRGDSLSVDYHGLVNFKPRAITENSGIWLLGSLANASYNGDDAFAIMAAQARGLVNSLVKKLEPASKSWPLVQARL